MKFIYLFVIVCSLSACNIQEVKPWEKAILSDKTMQLNANTTLNSLDAHFYYSKEGSSGGRSFSGGGCGCN